MEGKSRIECCPVWHAITTGLWLLFFILLCEGETAEIVVQLNNVTVLEGETAHFFCQARGRMEDIKLKIDDKSIALNFRDPDDMIITTENFTSGEEMMTHNISIAIINTSRPRNNTSLECYTINNRDAVPNATLTIIGGPAEPEVEYVIQEEEEEEKEGILLTWSPPFSWEDHPIIGYDVMCRNTETEMVVEKKRINETGDRGIVQYIVELSVSDCLTVQCSVTAYNDLGSSPSSIINISIPLKAAVASLGPGPAIDLVKSIVLDNGEPGIAVCVKLPMLCEFQTVRYTIVISVVAGDPVLQLSRDFSYSSGYTSQCIQVGGDGELGQLGQLEEGTEYSVQVFLYAGHSGNLSSPIIVFKPLQVPEREVSAVTNEIFVSGDGANTAEDDDQAKTGLIIDVAMGTVILIMIVILFIFAFIIIGMWRVSRRRSVVVKRSVVSGATNQVFDDQDSYSVHKEGGERSGEPYYHTLESSVEKTHKNKRQAAGSEPLYTTPFPQNNKT